MSQVIRLSRRALRTRNVRQDASVATAVKPTDVVDTASNPSVVKKKSIKTNTDLAVMDHYYHMHQVPNHIYLNPLGQVHRPWLKAHFETELTLMGVLRNVEHWGVGRRVQFRNDVDPAPSFNQVNREETRYDEPTYEYPDDARTSGDLDIDAVRHRSFRDQTYWTISRVFPDEKSPEMDYGHAYGYQTINGHTLEFEQLIQHAETPGWIVIPKFYEKPVAKQDPVIHTKVLYTPLPPLLSAQKQAQIAKTLNQNSTEEKEEIAVPLMRNIAARNDPECLVSFTVLENKHNPDLKRYL